MRIALVASLALATMLGSLTTGCTLTANGNSITGKTKTRFKTAATETRTQAFVAGNTIEIINAGVNPATDTTITVIGDPNATSVTATSPFIAWADSAEEANAKKAHADVSASFKISESGGKITVVCGNAAADYSTASKGSAGCEGLVVTVPASAAVRAVAGVGDVILKGLTASVTAEAQGAGDVTASITPSKGSVIDLKTDFDATLSLPATFSADLITIAGDKVVTTDFPELATGKAYGTAGEGAKSITVTAGDVGTATIKRQ